MIVDKTDAWELRKDAKLASEMKPGGIKIIDASASDVAALVARLAILEALVEERRIKWHDMADWFSVSLPITTAEELEDALALERGALGDKKEQP
jgi:hypothetical protein